MGRSTGREEYRKLQTIQNKLERTIYARNNSVEEKEIKRMPTAELLETNQTLSIHKLGAKSILNATRKILMIQKPRQLFNKLYLKNTREGAMWNVRGTPRLTISKSNLIEKGTKLWNQMNQENKEITNNLKFKKACKEWVKMNIQIKPG